MTRFLVLFGSLLIIALSLMMAGMMAQNGYQPYGSRHDAMVFAAALVAAAYVAWRIERDMLKRRDQSREASGSAKSGAQLL
jgi:membrane protein implicated in regulation of membrane protease activity